MGIFELSSEKRGGRIEDRMKGVAIFSLVVQLALLLFVSGSLAKESYFDMSLEELMQVEVTSASRREQSLSDTAAAVFVITQDDLRRTGVTSIPQALRMVPGVQVAKINSDNWAVSIRGFNDEFANKLLVLIDGRSIYSPVSSGVYWDEHLLPIDNIERIEVIRGPGGSLWGENAVNGIVNIITKKARDTQGFYLSTGVGNEDEGLLTLRYGGRWGDNTFFRIYAKGAKGDSSKFKWDGSSNDDRSYLSGGLRIDSGFSERDSLSITADVTKGVRDKDYYTADLRPPYIEELKYKMVSNTGHLTALWKHRFSERSSCKIKGYFWSEGRKYENYSFVSNTLDLEAEYQTSWRNHLLTVGGNYRHIWTHFWSTYQVGFWPSKRRDHFYGLFFQDEISLASNLKLILGSRLSHNPFSDWEIQPTARLLWHINPSNTLWLAVSRAVRTPDFGRHSLSLLYAVLPPKGSDQPLPVAIVGRGNRNLDSESVVSYEMGVRSKVSSTFNVDVSLFFNKYKKLLAGRTPVFSGVVLDPYPHVEISGDFGNLGDAESYGLEAVVNFEATPWWRLQGTFSFERLFVHYSDRVFLPMYKENEEEGRVPRHQFSLRSSWDIRSNLSFNTWVRYSDNLWKNGVPSYLAVDATIVWSPVKNLEISLSGFNLFDNRHTEFAPNITLQEVSEVERSFFGKITWRF